MLARAEVRCYILTLVQYYANTTDSYIHSVKTEPYVKEILNNLQYYPPETHPLSPAKTNVVGFLIYDIFLACGWTLNCRTDFALAKHSAGSS